MEDLDGETMEYLKNELAYLLKNTNDKWYQKKTASAILSYKRS